MKLALIGNGAMGRLVSTMARENADEIGLVLTSSDAGRRVSELATQLEGHDVAIDFSLANAVLKNVEACARARVPLVEGRQGGTRNSIKPAELSRSTKARSFTVRTFPLE